MKSARATPLRQMLGGKWFLERKTVALLIPFLLTTSVLSALAQLTSLGYQIGGYGLEIGKLVLANALAFLACWAIIECCNRTFLKGKELSGTPLALIALVSFTVGATKGLVTGSAAYWLGVFSSMDEAVGLKWLQTGILGLLLLPMLTLVLRGLEQIREKSQLLVSERVQLMLSQVDLQVSDSWETLQKFKANALKLIAQLDSELLRSPENKNLVAQGVRDLIDSHVRPLSRSIYNERQRLVLPFDLSWVLKTVYQGSWSGFFVAFVLIFVTIFMGYLQADGPGLAASQAFFATVIIAVITKVGLWVKPKTNAVSLLILIVVSGVAAFAGIFIPEVVFPVGGSTDVLVLWFAIWIVVLQNLVFAIVGLTVLDENKQLNIRLLEMFGESEFDSRARAAVDELGKRNLAQYLHSDVQNKLLATALALESEREPNARASLATLKTVIEGLSGVSTSNQGHTWETMQRAVREHWDGFVDVDVFVHPAVVQRISSPYSLIFEIAMEAISNALRHGKAKSILIRIEIDASDKRLLKLTVRDDGFGPKSGRKGLGSSLLSTATDGDWSLDPLDSGGAELTCRIAI